MNQYYQLNSEYCKKRRVLSYHSKGVERELVKQLEKDYGLDEAIKKLKLIQLERKLYKENDKYFNGSIKIN
jgi:ABC-type microcin C transport system permease subunit YejB